MQSFRRVRRKRTFLRVMRSYFEASSGAFYPQKRSFAAPCLAKKEHMTSGGKMAQRRHRRLFFPFRVWYAIRIRISYHAHAVSLRRCAEILWRAVTDRT